MNLNEMRKQFDNVIVVIILLNENIRNDDFFRSRL